MIDVVELKQLRDDLIRARSSGELQVQYQDRTVRYRSIDELSKAIARLDEDIAESEGTPRKSRVRRHAVRSEWCK